MQRYQSSKPGPAWAAVTQNKQETPTTTKVLESVQVADLAFCGYEHTAAAPC